MQTIQKKSLALFIFYRISWNSEQLKLTSQSEKASLPKTKKLKKHSLTLSK